MAGEAEGQRVTWRNKESRVAGRGHGDRRGQGVALTRWRRDNCVFPAIAQNPCWALITSRCGLSMYKKKPAPSSPPQVTTTDSTFNAVTFTTNTTTTTTIIINTTNTTKSQPGSKHSGDTSAV
ncbi:hypothetical protein E2C01_018659 [Portunus trituberculatus]|uniref:Uncharacterized protein n=1 Tax=Portunus trituberculatus TaxID=210409 RepID=A0A5B7DV18_PORTR|nr:hypothetical protein [Portunus trituberculatus]